MFRLSLSRLKWLTVLVPALFIGMYEYLENTYLESAIPPGIDTLASFVIVLVGGMLFSHLVFHVIDQMKAQIESQTDRAQTLLRVAGALNSSLDLNRVLQTMVDEARQHLGADMGEVHILGESGKHGVRFSGISAGNCRVRQRPTLSSLNGEVLRTGQVLRLANRHDHPASRPLPPGHPEIGPFLGVPVIVKGECVADILLVRSPHRPPFTSADEEFLTTIAHQAALALHNARLYEQTESIAVLQERERLSRELHDGLAQILGYLTIESKLALSHLAQRDISQGERALEEVCQTAEEAYQEIRQSLFDLRTHVTPAQSFLGTLMQYVERFSAYGNLQVDVELKGTNDLHLNPAVEVQLIRIVQEAMNNIRRHAGAHKAWIRFDLEDDTLRVAIQDDGVGFDLEQVSRSDPSSAQHLGLHSMRERATSVGGALEIESWPGQGTCVTVILPYEEVQNETDTRTSGRRPHPDTQRGR
jgi:signal transduction histidine kinase